MRDFWDPRPQRVAVFRALQLGDMLCAVPAFRALRAFLPRARITLVGLPWAASFAQRYAHLIDDFIAFPGWPGNPESDAPVAPMLDALIACQQRHFDVAIQMHGSGALSNRVVAMMGAQRVGGFGVGRPSFLRWPDSQNEIHRYLSLMSFLGVPLQGDHLEMPLTAEDEADARGVMQRHGLLPGHFVCLHPGSQLPSRRWPVERFAAVGTALCRQGWRIAVTGTPGERDLTDTLLRSLPRGAVDLNGATTLGSLAALVRESALLVCNDTGISHVAAAVGARSVVVASGSDVPRWRPLDRSRHPVLWHDVPCRPCTHRTCPTNHECALGVAVDTVLAEARRLLPERLPHAA